MSRFAFCYVVISSSIRQYCSGDGDAAREASLLCTYHQSYFWSSHYLGGYLAAKTDPGLRGGLSGSAMRCWGELVG